MHTLWPLFSAASQPIYNAWSNIWTVSVVVRSQNGDDHVRTPPNGLLAQKGAVAFAMCSDVASIVGPWCAMCLVSDPDPTVWRAVLGQCQRRNEWRSECMLGFYTYSVDRCSAATSVIVAVAVQDGSWEKNMRNNLNSTVVMISLQGFRQQPMTCCNFYGIGRTLAVTIAAVLEETVQEERLGLCLVHQLASHELGLWLLCLHLLVEGLRVFIMNSSFFSKAHNAILDLEAAWHLCRATCYLYHHHAHTLFVEGSIMLSMMIGRGALFASRNYANACVGSMSPSLGQMWGADSLWKMTCYKRENTNNIIFIIIVVIG